MTVDLWCHIFIELQDSEGAMKRQAGDNVAADRAAFNGPAFNATLSGPAKKSRRRAVELLSRAARLDAQFERGQGDLLPDLWLLSTAVGPSLYKGPPRQPEVVVISDDDTNDEHDDHEGAK